MTLTLLSEIANTPTYPLDHMNREPLIVGIQLQILDRCAQWVCHEVKMRFSAAQVDAKFAYDFVVLATVEFQ